MDKVISKTAARYYESIVETGRGLNGCESGSFLSRAHAAGHAVVSRESGRPVWSLTPAGEAALAAYRAAQ